MVPKYNSGFRDETDFSDPEHAGNMRADRDRYPFHPPIRCHISRYHKKCQNQQHFIIVPFRVLELSAGEFIPRLFSSGGIHPTIWSSCCIDCRYHYITVPGHPSDSDVYYVNETIMYHYITVPGHPSDEYTGGYRKSGVYHYITVPGHPSDNAIGKLGRPASVPLHYSSGASIRHQERFISRSRRYHYITVPGHPSDLTLSLLSSKIGTITLQFRGIHPTCFWFRVYLFLYHYITVPGHPSDISFVGAYARFYVPLHYSSGASIRHDMN